MDQDKPAKADSNDSLISHNDQRDSTSLYDFCRKCPKTVHCCYRATTIVVLPDEARNLIERIGSDHFLRPESHGLFTIVKNSGEPCPLLTTDGLCSVYDIRPTDCRSWPITLAPNSNGHTEYLTDMGCPIPHEDKLDQTFLTSAKQVLGSIDLTVRAKFIELVHRDSLPLMPLEENED